MVILPDRPLLASMSLRYIKFSDFPCVRQKYGDFQSMPFMCQMLLNPLVANGFFCSRDPLNPHLEEPSVHGNRSRPNLKSDSLPYTAAPGKECLLNPRSRFPRQRTPSSSIQRTSPEAFGGGRNLCRPPPPLFSTRKAFQSTSWPLCRSLFPSTFV